MPTELLPNRVTATVTLADEEAFFALLAQALGMYPKSPVLDKDTYQSLDKMGPAKRVEYDAKMPIMMKHQPPLVEPLSIQGAETKVSMGDAAMRAADKFNEMAAYMTRFATIAYAEGYNMMKCCEEESDMQASRRNEAAIATRNEIQDIDKKKLAELAKEKTKVDKLADKKVAEKLKTMVTG
jgi:hypothetical protein